MVFHVSGGEVEDASVDRSTVICFLPLSMALPVLLPGLTRPTWAYFGPSLISLFGLFVLTMLASIHLV
jgi:hypothetical protein